jgi:hypothetical protein
MLSDSDRPLADDQGESKGRYRLDDMTAESIRGLALGVSWGESSNGFRYPPSRRGWTLLSA